MAANKKTKTSDKVVQMEKKQTLKDLNFNGIITKIKISAKNDVPEINYKLATDVLGAEIVVEGKGRASDDFLKAMQTLNGIFCDICEIDEKADDVTITVVNFKKNGVVISGQVELTQNNIPVPLFINTPFVVMKNDKGGYELPAYAQKQLDELQRQAVLYMRGEEKETQLDLFGNYAAVS